MKSFNTLTEWPLILGTDLVVHLRGDLRSPTGPVPVEIAVGALLSKSSTPIGNIKVFIHGCTPTTTTLVCPTDTGVKVWRFAS